MKKTDTNRRQLLAMAGLSGLGLIASKGLAQSITPPQTEGPFFPVSDQVDKDADLTQVKGSTLVARGEQVRVKGLVLDHKNEPISGALIDVWQACDTGRYNHPLDPNTSVTLDPNFQYWAKLKSDANGEFSFKTIIPGAYPATSSWDRPPHIHFRVDVWGLPRLTTQMYFKGQPLNEQDRIIKNTRAEYGDAAAESLIVDFDEIGEDGIPTGLFVLKFGETPKIAE